MLKKTYKLLSIFLILSMTLPVIVESSLEVEEIQNYERDIEFVRRLAGESKVETSVEVSKEIYKNGAKNVMLVGCNGEVDFLAGTLLAKKLDGPLLFTKKDNLLKATELEIRRLNPEKIYIIGGENVISEAVELELGKMYPVKRIKGKDRVDTSIQIAKELKEKINHVFLVKGYGEVLGDALVIGSVSAKENIPILLTKEDKIPKETEKALIDFGVSHITIIGGEKAVSLELEESLNKKYIVDRLGGYDREKTSMALAHKYFKGSENLLIACEENNSDALLAAYVGSKINAPVFLCHKDKLSIETKAYIENNPSKTFIIGGKLRISEYLFKELESLIASRIKKDIIVDRSISLEKDYNSIRIIANDVTIDLNGNSVKELIIDGDNCRLKNGNIYNINIEKDRINLILDDISDYEDSQHVFYGGGINSIVIKGETLLQGTIEIRSLSPLQIRGEELEINKGIKGRLKIKTSAKIIIGVAVDRIEIYEENADIDIRAEVREIIVWANSKIKIAKGIKRPSLEKGKGVILSIEDANHIEEDIRYPLPRPNQKPSIDEDKEIEEKPDTGEDENTNEDQEINISIPEGLESFSASGENMDDGKITGVDKTMEYRLKGATDFIAVDGREISGLKVGIYEIRFAAKEDIQAGKILEIRIEYIGLFQGDFVDGKITKYNKDVREVIIPSKVIVNGVEVEVKEIGNKAFSSNKELRKIVLPNTLISIGKSAFQDCKSLKSIEIPNSVTTMESHVFKGCSELESVKLEDGLELISDSAFADCSKLKNINIPNTVKTIGNSAFHNCEALESIDIPDKVKSVGMDAFWNCKKLASITIPESVTSLGNRVFKDCSLLSQITLSKSIDRIGNDTFNACKALENITIPDSVTSIGYSAFETCQSLKSITIPTNVENIAEKTFYGCSKLREINLSNKIKTIDEQAFRLCEELGTIIIPDSVKSMKNNSFQGCLALENVKIGANIELSGEIPFSKKDFIKAYTANGRKAGIYKYTEKAWEMSE